MFSMHRNKCDNFLMMYFFLPTNKKQHHHNNFIIRKVYSKIIINFFNKLLCLFIIFWKLLNKVIFFFRWSSIKKYSSTKRTYLYNDRRKEKRIKETTINTRRNGFFNSCRIKERFSRIFLSYYWKYLFKRTIRKNSIIKINTGCWRFFKSNV